MEKLNSSTRMEPASKYPLEHSTYSTIGRPASAGGFAAPRRSSPVKQQPTRTEKFTPRSRLPFYNTTAIGSTPSSAMDRKSVADILARYASPSVTAAATTTPVRGGSNSVTARIAAASSASRMRGVNSVDRSEASPGADFIISAYKPSGSGAQQHPPNSAGRVTPFTAAAAASGSIQAQLHIKDLELHKLTNDHSALRKEVEALKSRLSQRRTELEASTSAKLTLEVSQRQAQREVEAAKAATAAARAEADSLRLALCQNQAGGTVSATLAHQLSELQASKMETEQQLANMAKENKLLEAQACKAQEACAQHEERIAELQAEVDRAAESSEEQRSPLFTEVRRLGRELHAMEQRCLLAEAALKTERSRNTAASGRSNRAESVLKTENALTDQIRTLAQQLQAAQREAAVFKEQINGFPDLEAKTEALETEKRHAQDTLNAMNEELMLVKQQLQETQETVESLRDENSVLHDALRSRDSELVRNSNDVSGVSAKLSALEREKARLEGEVKSSKKRIVELEDFIATQGGTNGSSGLHMYGMFDIPTTSAAVSGTSNHGNHNGQASPLRDIVAKLRADLHDKELRLAAALEEAESERRHAEDLQHRLLDQALELDDVQGMANNRLQHQVHVGLEAQERLDKHVCMLEQQLEHERSTAGAARVAALNLELEGARQMVEGLKAERDLFKAQCESREVEVMQLQGQLRMLENHPANEVENWLMM